MPQFTGDCTVDFPVIPSPPPTSLLLNYKSHRDMEEDKGFGGGDGEIIITALL